VAGVDLVVATGAQYMSDACRDDALRVLDRLETANRRGIPTAMVGQGVGPFDDAELRRRACAVYPLVDLVFVRDRVAGAQLLGSLGVDPARVVFTGDDAIELAYEERRPSLGNAVGVSLRLAPYTVVAGADVAALAGVLRGKSRGWRVPIVPVPISFSRHELDERALRAIAGRTPWTRRPLGRFRTPREIARSVGRCRLVVTGTFHAGVFALAQGIPVVGLARSRMYEQKFESLADQFGPGCQVVRLDRPAFRDELATAMDSAWRDAEQLRPTLLRTAHELAVLGRDAYGRLRDLVPGRAGG
jgi:polysaccharide pyruvyl transferase WcaK-like protein